MMVAGHIWELLMVAAMLVIVVGIGGLIVLMTIRVGARAAAREYARERERMEREQRPRGKS